MDEETRERLRNKQDYLIGLATVRFNNDDSTVLTSACYGSPTIGQLRQHIFPEWEHVIDSVTNHLLELLGGKPS